MTASRVNENRQLNGLPVRQRPQILWQPPIKQGIMKWEVAMGFRFQKSINLGGGFRINLSKSGVGFSWGQKGFRITKTATGKTRQTVSIPGTGLSWVNESKKKKDSKKKK